LHYTIKTTKITEYVLQSLRVRTSIIQDKLKKSKSLLSVLREYISKKLKNVTKREKGNVSFYIHFPSEVAWEAAR